jgi:hypothetical protein
MWLFSRSTWFMRSLRTVTACAGVRVVYTLRERMRVGRLGTSSPAMLGILCVEAPWRDHEVKAHSHDRTAGYNYIEIKSGELVEVS